MAYVEALVEADIKDKKWMQFLPLELRTALESATLVEALELTFKATRQYTPQVDAAPWLFIFTFFCNHTAFHAVFSPSFTPSTPNSPQHFFDEIQGFADGAGVDASVIIHLNMIPELVKAACSMLGAWGPATSKSTAGLVQLRALDWGLDSPLVRFHQLTVYQPPPLTSTPLLRIKYPFYRYHPSDGTRSFATMGWTGFVGAITVRADDLGGGGLVLHALRSTHAAAGL